MFSSATARAALCLVATLLLAAPPPPASAQQPAAEQGELLREYVEAFKSLGLVAITAPMGQQPGDVVDHLGQEYVSKADECFQGLRPHEDPSHLTNVDLSFDAALRFGLVAKPIAELGVEAHATSRVILRFDHVTAKTVSQLQFGQTIQSAKCAALARLIGKDPAALGDTTMLLGEVFYARAIIRLDRTRGGGASVSASFLSKLVSKLGLRLSAEAGGNVASADVVELGGDQDPLPVAFRPAFIKLDPTQPGFKGTEGSPNAPTIVNFNAQSPLDRAALGALIDRSLPGTIAAMH